MKETLDNSRDFEPGELMPWQEMSATIRDLSAAHQIDGMTIQIQTELIAVLRAEVSDIKTRLDDLEDQVGKVSPNWVCSEDEARKHDVCPCGHVLYLGESGLCQECSDRIDMEVQIEDGTHPPNCRCAWCEPGDGSAWGS